MNVVCYERVCYEWVCYECGLVWVARYMKKRLKRNDEICYSLSNSMQQTLMEICAKFRQTIVQELGGPRLFVRSAKEAEEIGS